MCKLFFILVSILCSSCASMPPDPPSLENRSLRISETFPGFEYQYEKCVRKGLFGSCLRTEWVRDTYDLTDPTIRMRLIDKGFVAKVREKVQP